MLKLQLAVAALMLTLQAVPPAPVPSPDGAIATPFHDPETGVSYGLPADFQSRPEAAAAFEKGFVAATATDPDRAVEAKCLAIPLVATKGTAAPQTGEFGMIVLMRVDYGCAGEENGEKYLGEDAQRLMRILGQFGAASTDDALKYRLGGHPAAFVKGSAPAKMLGGDARMHGASVCTLLGTKTLCWLILDTNHKAMPVLVATPVTFNGGTPAPLVPKDIVEAW